VTNRFSGYIKYAVRIYKIRCTEFQNVTPKKENIVTIPENQFPSFLTEDEKKHCKEVM